ncbi:MAG: molybdenum cofactor guanylyltransferase [Chloracidobacterium sp.]|nr:molybdenum cofactor guanylyltransferase [Chloracidobacterium sp.]
MNLIDGFVLAGGQSRRMGQNKASLLLGGKTLVNRAALALSVIADQVYAVGNLTNKITALPIIPDEPVGGNARGAIVGVYTALLHANTEWVAVLACDLPFVTGELLARMVAFLPRVADAHHENVDAVFAEQSDGRNQPLCGLYRRDTCLPKIDKMLADSDWRLQQLRVRLRTRLISFSEITDIHGAEFFFHNLNTPDDYRVAVEIKKQMRLQSVLK